MLFSLGLYLYAFVSNASPLDIQISQQRYKKLLKNKSSHSFSLHITINGLLSQ